MSSTEIGVPSQARPSSRVLKPPGGGHSNIFGEPEVAVNAPRPKYNQQNSSNLNACMGSEDPNKKVEQLRDEIKQTTPTEENHRKHSGQASNQEVANGNGNGNDAAGSRGRVPPGGFSSGGFW